MTVLFTEAFSAETLQNLSTYNPAWQSTDEADAIRVIDYQARSGAGAIAGYRYTGVTFPNDQFAECEMVALGTDSEDQVGPSVRAASSNTFYGYLINATNRRVFKMIADTLTTISSASASTSVGDMAKIEVIGTSIYPYINGEPDADVGGPFTDGSLTSGYAGITGVGLPSTTRIDNWSGGDFVLGAVDTMVPDAILASTNLTGAVTDIDEGVSSPDGSWLTATSATANTSLRVSFDVPIAELYLSQVFRCYVRKTTGTPNPTLTMRLWQNGALRTSLTSVAVTSATGQTIEATWEIGDLATVLDGSDVECLLDGAAAGSPGASPAYASTSTIYANETVSGTYSISLPATIDAGNLLVCQVMTESEDNNTSATMNTGGWTAFPGNPYGGIQNVRQCMFWLIADGTEDGTNVSITSTGSGDAQGVYSKTWRFAAADGFAADPIVSINATSGSVANIAAPTVTPTGPNQLAVCLIAVRTNLTVPAFTGETGGDWALNVTNSTIGGNNATLACQSASQTAGAEISGGTATIAVTNWTTIGFAVVPANTAAENTVEIGAVDWLMRYSSGGPQSSLHGGTPNMTGGDYYAGAVRSW